MTDTTQAAEPTSLDGMPMLLTVKDVETELQLGRTRTYELVRSGELPVVRIGRVVRIPRAALQRWIDARLGEGANQSAARLAPATCFEGTEVRGPKSQAKSSPRG